MNTRKISVEETTPETVVPVVLKPHANLERDDSIQNSCEPRQIVSRRAANGFRATFSADEAAMLENGTIAARGNVVVRFG